MVSAVECLEILKSYPDSITENQFYRVARVSKRHAKYLLDAGIVPCENSGKKTHKYKIRTRDVIIYLYDRENNPEKYKPPRGFYRVEKKPCLEESKKAIICFDFTEAEKSELYLIWEQMAAPYNDVMTVPEVSTLTGYSVRIVYRWCRKKLFVNFKISGKTTIPKLAVIEFMAGDKATSMAYKSKKHLEILCTYAQECHEGAMTITY